MGLLSSPLAHIGDESAMMGSMPEDQPVKATNRVSALTITPTMEIAFILGIVGLFVAGPVGGIVGAVVAPLIPLVLRSQRHSDAAKT